MSLEISRGPFCFNPKAQPGDNTVTELCDFFIAREEGLFIVRAQSDQDGNNYTVLEAETWHEDWMRTEPRIYIDPASLKPHGRFFYDPDGLAKAKAQALELILSKVQHCRVCNCTNYDCSQCIEAQGGPCHWVEKDLCSRCY